MASQALQLLLSIPFKCEYVSEASVRLSLSLKKNVTFLHIQVVQHGFKKPTKVVEQTEGLDTLSPTIQTRKFCTCMVAPRTKDGLMMSMYLIFKRILGLQ